MSTKHNDLFYEREDEFNKALTGSQFAVLHQLAIKANAEGEVEDYAQAKLAQHIGYSHDSVKRAMKVLEQRGLIRREKVMNTGYCRYPDTVILYLEEEPNE